VGAAAVLGLVGRRHLGGAADRRRLTRLFLVDAGILVAIAVLSSMLTLSSPHVGHPDHGAHPGEARCAATAGDRSVSVIATPGRVGTNGVLVGGLPADLPGVTLGWVHDLTEGGALTMEAAPEAAGWTASGVLPLAGAWEVTVVVRVDTFTEERGSCAMTVAP
jgi:hypothetical protein